MPRGSRRAAKERAALVARAVAEAEGESGLDVGRILGGATRTELWRGLEYLVRSVGPAAKEYRCPGCDLLVAPGTPHTVVWEAEGLFGAEAAIADRRHWHTRCWSARR